MARSRVAASPSLAEFVDDLQGRGRYVFTRAEAAKAVGGSEVALAAGLRRLKNRRRIASPRQGFFLIVPIEYRDAGSPPASWFIDDLMRHLGQPYYVGLLSAAAIHGAGHQQPMMFQVVTDRPTRPARAGKARIVFHVSRGIGTTPVAKVETETGSMRVSTPEATAFDLVRFAKSAGHLDNIATVLGELSERFSDTALVKAASFQAVPDVQRMGYLLDLVGERPRADALVRWLSDKRYRPVLLARGRAAHGAKPDPRWRVRPNVAVESDL